LSLTAATSLGHLLKASVTCRLYKQTQVLLLSPVFFVSGYNVCVGIATHFRGILTVCKFAFVI